MSVWNNNVSEELHLHCEDQYVYSTDVPCLRRSYWHMQMQKQNMRQRPDLRCDHWRLLSVDMPHDRCCHG